MIGVSCDGRYLATGRRRRRRECDDIFISIFDDDLVLENYDGKDEDEHDDDDDDAHDHDDDDDDFLVCTLPYRREPSPSTHEDSSTNAL